MDLRRGDPPPARPGAFEERLASALFFALGPRLPPAEPTAPPAELSPWEVIRLARSSGRPSALEALWFSAEVADPAGAVLFLHPWMEWGKAYFYRRGRIAAVRRAGLHALAVDLPAFGGSGARRGFLDSDVADALSALEDRCPGLPLYVWGISSGGYWAHLSLSRRPLVTAALFEDVSPHLLEWSWRIAPWGRPAYLFFRHVFRRSYRFLDLRSHAPWLGLRQAAYVSGAEDPGIRPNDTETSPA